MIKDHISTFTLKFKDTEFEAKVIQLFPPLLNMRQIFIFQPPALQSNFSRQSQTSKKSWVETLGHWGIGPIVFQLIQLASYNIISLYPYSFQYVRHRQKDNTIKSSLFSVIWVWILILISGVFQIVLHLEWYLSDFL